MDRLSTAKENSPGIADVAADFGKSFVQGAIISPVWNGLGQLISAGQLPQISITNADNAKASTADAWAQKIGGAAGMAADFFVLSKVKAGVFGETAAAETASTLPLAQRSLASAAESAKVGAVYGAVFVPSVPGDNLLVGRFKNAITNGITFGALGGLTEGVGGLPIFGKIKPGTMAHTVKDIGVATAVGFPAGAIGAETDAMLNHGKPATWSSIKDQSTDYGVIGFVLAGLTHGAGALTPGSRPIEPEMAHVSERSITTGITSGAIGKQLSKPTFDQAGANALEAGPGSKTERTMRTQFNPLDSLKESNVSRNDISVKSAGQLEENFQQFRAIMEAPGAESSPGALMKAEDRAQLLADEFLTDHHQIDLQKRIIEWARSQPDQSIADYIDWRLSPQKRSAVLTNDYISLAKADEIDAYQFERTMRSPFELSNRAAHYHVTPEQIFATKQNVVQLMEIADANRGPNEELTRAGNTFRMAALQSMAQAADPFLIVQGNHPTCALTQLEFSTYLKHPDEATRVINEVMRTGNFVTQDGSVIQIKPGSLKPEAGSLEPNVTRYESSPAYRSYASQIFQMTAANIYWQRQTITPDGRTVPAGSLHYEISSRATRGTGDVLVDYSKKLPRVVAKGPKIMDLAQLEDIGIQIGGEQTKPNVSMTLPGTKEELAKFLQTIPYPEGFPLIVPIDADALQDETIPAAQDMNHAVSILAPWIQSDRLYFRNTWRPGDMVHEHIQHERFANIGGYAP